MNFLLGPTGDIALVAGQIVFVFGDQAVKQHVRNRLLFVRGEWYVDRRLGVPYYQNILIKNPDLDALRALFRRVIVETPGVASCETLQLDLSPARVATVSFAGRLDSGGTLEYKALVLGSF